MPGPIRAKHKGVLREHRLRREIIATVAANAMVNEGGPSLYVRLREETGSDNLGPVISRVRHEPPVPAPGTPVRFHARVTDADGVKSVKLHWQIDGETREA